MILTKEVEITITNNRKYYTDLGYNIPKHQYPIIKVKIEDLPKNSHKKINCKCDICDTIKNITYRRYLESVEHGGFYTCQKCHHVKSEKTCLIKYGVNNISQLPEIKAKKIKNSLEKYGVENVLQSEEIKNKIKNTCLEKYGVEYPQQSKKIRRKQQKASLTIRKYKNTNLHYQGTYEKDFLDNYINKINIDNGPTIKYNYENKNKVYFSDFFIKSKNLIIEIKSDYTYNLHLEKNLTKQKACVEQGYIFIFIINKDYSELNNTFLK